MARIIGGLGTSHVPSIGVMLDRGLADGPDWKPLFEGYAMPQQWMRDHRPDIAVVIFNDHGNSFFLDRVPTFAVGGSEGAELMMWLVMRGAMNREVRTLHTHYHVPASMTGAGCVVMENA